MATDENLRIRALGLTRAIRDVGGLEYYAELQGIKLPEQPDVYDMDVIFQDTFLREFPAVGEMNRIGLLVNVYRIRFTRDWSVRIILRCGDHEKKRYHHEAVLQCIYRYNRHRDVEIHVKDTSGLLRRKLGITAEPQTYIDTRKQEWEMVALSSRTSALDEMMKKMLSLYFEQPLELISTEHFYNHQRLAKA